MEKRTSNIAPFLIGLSLAAVAGILFTPTVRGNIKHFLFGRIKSILLHKFKALLVSTLLSFIAENLKK